MAVGPNSAKTISGLVLREGDLVTDGTTLTPNDNVDLNDFQAWKANYNTAPTADDAKRSDFNQSGYVDIL
ncbi:MAG: hypothetical protein EBT09_07980, partial [Actinobacteria bacterium]|nr:hypothetical protein [Actinomycetota bacterium]